MCDKLERSGGGRSLGSKVRTHRGGIENVCSATGGGGWSKSEFFAYILHGQPHMDPFYY